MPAFKNIIGLRFGRLVALERQVGRQTPWLCRCDCGKTPVVNSWNLASGHTKSCGCLHRDAITTHGQTKTPTWQSWQSMHKRCRNPKHPAFPRYGGRGVGIDDPRWHEYLPFLVDMGEQPPGCQLHRKDNDKGYSKENCIWLPRAEHTQLHAAARRRRGCAPRLPSEDARS